MVYQYDDRDDDRLDVEQPRARQVGVALPTRAKQPERVENASRAGPELDEMVEQVCWVMRREPIRERGRGGLAL